MDVAIFCQKTYKQLIIHNGKKLRIFLHKHTSWTHTEKSKKEIAEPKNPTSHVAQKYWATENVIYKHNIAEPAEKKTNILQKKLRELCAENAENNKEGNCKVHQLRW